MKVGDSIRIVKASDDMDWCGVYSWHVPYQILSAGAGGNHYYFYNKYKDVVGVILKTGYYKPCDCSYFIVLIGIEKVICVKDVMEKISG